jgi:hypothetical protein
MRLPALRALPSEPPTFDALADMPSRAPWCAARADHAPSALIDTSVISAHGTHAASAKITIAASITPTSPRASPVIAAAAAWPASERTVMITGFIAISTNSTLTSRDSHSRNGGQIDAASAAGKKSTAM